jgi:hypothetical protein
VEDAKVNDGRRMLDDLMEDIRGLTPRSPVVTYVDVSPDVWEHLCAAVPICRGSSLTTPSFQIRINTALPRGTMVPLDQDGKPIPKPGART